ncbi:exodeoxyribonuclease I [Candidatus Zinderia endosymbiont of Aphrophora alni]|uniref:exodeoxyribonuclease I n=1 Tax=Candidatus Zinderia endosymbiont of Aphrophora alni TaxID=3077951 RepID=UPI0030D13412
MKNTFLWHDYETFSLNPRFTRPAQFAAVRTDLELNEIEKPILIYCKLANDFIPDPSSCLITKITPGFCFKNGISENLFAEKIKKIMSVPNTINVGYNNISFDDEVTRFMMWRNLIDPYSHTWKKKCSRWDLINLIKAVYIFNNKSIFWPKDNEGFPSFKLENLVKINGLLNVKLHDALVDVKSTIFLAKIIKKNNLKLFNFCVALRQKQRVLIEIGFYSKKPFLYISGFFSRKYNCLSIMLFLTINPFNKNEVLAWDLSYNIFDFVDFNKNRINDFFIKQIKFIYTKKNNKSPIKIIYLNKSPFVVNNLKVLSKKILKKFKIKIDVIYKNFINISKIINCNFVFNDIFYKFSKKKIDIEYNLYENFISENDKKKLLEIKKLFFLKKNKKIYFENKSLKDLVFRYKARNFYEILSLKEKKEWSNYLCSVFFFNKNNFFTINKCLKKILFLKKQSNNYEKKILNSLLKYIKFLILKI